VVFYKLDLSDEKSIRDIIDWIHIKLGEIDVIVNSAGIHEGFGIQASSEAAKEIF